MSEQLVTIPDLLDLAKEENNIKSDRQLAAALGLAHLHPYRTKGVIPNDITAFRLAELCGMEARQVLTICHILRIRQVAHGKPVEVVYQDILSMIRKAAAVFLLVATLAIPYPAKASVGQVSVFTASQESIYIMRRLFSAAKMVPAHLQSSNGLGHASLTPPTLRANKIY